MMKKRTKTPDFLERGSSRKYSKRVIASRKTYVRKPKHKYGDNNVAS